MKLNIFNKLLFPIICLSNMPVIGMKKVLEAIVITAEPLVAQVYSPRLVLQDIDKRLLLHSLQNNMSLTIDIEKHPFFIPALHLGRNPSYGGIFKNPFVIQVTVGLHDTSNLARYILELQKNDQLCRLEGSYTKYEINGNYCTLTSTFPKKAPLVEFLRQAKKNTIT